MFNGKFTKKIDLPKISDPVFEEGKKEEKAPPPKPVKKGDKPPVEEEPKPVEEEKIDYTYLRKGERVVTFIPVHFNIP
jgi:hypothetical protein